MSEAGADWHGDEQERGRLRHDAPEQHLPQVGMEVAGYRLERRLATGGQGTVFRARREGRLYAVKFIFLPRSAQWARRELDVMVKLWRAGSLPLEGHGLWPAPRPLFLFLVTPYVRGRPLDEWVRVHNPHALAVVELVRQAARLLGVVHAAGVVHRDVKGGNLLVGAGGRLVLVDFGVATYAGAPSVTGPFPPGTWAYLSPRVWRAWRGEEDSRASPGDDLWALGVELYQVLTGRLPFQGEEGELVRAILKEEPPPPHALNPRVPRALGEVCQRMLRKNPEERYADAAAVDAALEAAAREADETWRVPLCEAWSPHHATTVREGLWMQGEELLALYERLASYQQRPLRGRPLPPDEASTQGADSLPPEEEAEEVPPAPAREQAAPPDASLPVRSRWRLPATGVVLTLALGLGVWLAVRPAPRTSSNIPSWVGAPRANPPPEHHPITLEPLGQEVAPPWRRPEGDGGAASKTAELPAPVARAAPAKDTRVKTLPKAPTPQQRKSQPKETSNPVGKVGGLMLTCTLASGCTGPTVQVRPPPPPAECPPGSVEAMKALGLEMDWLETVAYPGMKHPRDEFPVRSGPGAVLHLRGKKWGKLPNGTVFSGVLFVGESRVYGRFTQAYTPEGHMHPVCLELYDAQKDDKRGVFRVDDGKSDTARIGGVVHLRPVEQFE